MGQSESKVLSFLLVTGAVSLLGKTAVSLWRANREGLPGNPRIEEGSWVWVLGSSLVGLILLSVVVWLQRRGGKSGKGKPGDYVSFERQFAILFMVRGFLRRLQTAKIRKRKEEQLMELNAHFKPVTEISNEDKERILSRSVVQLLELMRSGELTSELLVRVYCERAMRCGKLHNCITDQCYGKEEAIQAAIQADEHLQKTKEMLGPLHGIPVSIKDCFDIKGMDSTAGIDSRCFCPMEEDSAIVKMVRRAGGIPFVKTNLMQCLCGIESSNPIFGRVKNPWNPNRTPGGSSGGESALVASYGSPLGIGSDIGGSIRIPSHFCGLYGFKPTGRRISKQGVDYGLGQFSIIDSFGPLARSAGDLVVASRVLFSKEHWKLDSNVPPVPFNERLYSKYSTPRLGREREGEGEAQTKKRKIRFGYYLDDGFVEPFAGCRRAVVEAKDALESAGFEVVPFPIEDIGVEKNAMATFIALVTANHSQNFLNDLKKSEVDPALRLMLLGAQVPGFLTSVAGIIIKNVVKDDRVALMLRNSVSKSVYEYQALQRKQVQLQQRMQQKMKDMNVDVLLSPVNATVAIPHSTQIKLTPLVTNYTMLYNLLDFPAGSVPVTCVTAEDIETKRTRVRRSQVDALLEEIETSNPKDTIGLPIGVQIAALPWKDEVCLAAMELLSGLIPFEHGKKNLGML